MHILTRFYKHRQLSLSGLSPGRHNGYVTEAGNKNVIVIGGGDTGVDCVATCVRQVTQNHFFRTSRYFFLIFFYPAMDY